jgi:hypothetical protein
MGSTLSIVMICIESFQSLFNDRCNLEKQLRQVDDFGVPRNFDFDFALLDSDIGLLENIALNASILNPKFSINHHSLQGLYGSFLLSFIRKHRHRQVRVRLLDVNIDCKSARIPMVRKSAAMVWNQFLSPCDISSYSLESNDDWCAKHAVWVLNSSSSCVFDKAPLEGFDNLDPNPMLFTMNNKNSFDVVIGGAAMKYSTLYDQFVALWGAITPGGYYVIEALDLPTNIEKVKIIKNLAISMLSPSLLRLSDFPDHVKCITFMRSGVILAKDTYAVGTILPEVLYDLH